MGRSATSTIIFGFVVGSGEEQVEHVQKVLNSMSFTADTPHDEVRIGVGYVGDDATYRIGFELYHGDWDEPLEIELAKLSFINTAVKVEEIRLFCEKHGIKFEEPKYLLVTDYW